MVRAANRDINGDLGVEIFGDFTAGLKGKKVQSRTLAVLSDIAQQVGDFFFLGQDNGGLGKAFLCLSYFVLVFL